MIVVVDTTAITVTEAMTGGDSHLSHGGINGSRYELKNLESMSAPPQFTRKRTGPKQVAEEEISPQGSIAQN